MLENSVWRQYHQDIDIMEVLSRFYASWEMELIDDERILHDILKAKLTKKEFRLFAMLSADIDAQKIKERFGYSDAELEKATYKLYKKLKQDKVRLAFVKRYDDEINREFIN